MNFLNKLSVLFLFTALLLTACNKENIDEIVPEDPNFQAEIVDVNSIIGAMEVNSFGGLELNCVTLNYPFELTLESNVTVAINSEAEFQSAIEREAPNRVVDFAFPLNITAKDGTTLEVNDNIELGVNYASCVPKKGWTKSNENTSIMPAFLLYDYCLELEYPINLKDNQDNDYLAESDADVIQYLTESDELFFMFPISVTNVQNTSTVESLEEIFNIFGECESSTYEPIMSLNDSTAVSPFDCFTFVYPFDAILIPQDSLITVNSEDELVLLSLEGYELDFVYPLDVIDSNENLITISAPEDFIPLFIDCEIITIDTTSTNICNTEAHVLLFFNSLNILTLNNYEYTINFPVTLVVEGESIVINNEDEYLPAIGGSPFDFKPTDITYPVTITQFGRDIILNNDDEVCDFYQTLDEACENKPSHIQLFFNGGSGSPISCVYYIEYPIDVTSNGTTIQIQNRDEYLTELNAPNAYDDIELVYPINVLTSQGAQLVFGSDEDICEYLDNCN